jgi:hypothetical protein
MSTDYQSAGLPTASALPHKKEGLRHVLLAALGLTQCPFHTAYNVGQVVGSVKQRAAFVGHDDL